MSGRKKPDRVISQFSLWGQVETLRETFGLQDACEAPPVSSADQVAARLSRLDGQLQAAARQPQPERGLSQRTLSLFDNTQTQKEFADQIVGLLEKVCWRSGNSAYRVFDDWTRLVEASLEMLPTHLASAAQRGQLAEDTPEVKRLFDEMRARYHPDCFELFAKAFALLLDSTTFGYMDVIGEVFMTFTNPKPQLGQYMTPWNVCVAMSAMAFAPLGGEQEVHARLKQAIDQSPLAQAALLAGLMFKEGEEDQAFAWFINRVIPPALVHYSPITVCDPCIGSGRMVLAAAATFSPWMVHLGLVQFFGADIDELMVRMARINITLYGLNGTGLRYAQALAGVDPEFLRERYGLSDDPQRARDSVLRMEDPTPERVMENVQVSLFGQGAQAETRGGAPGQDLAGKRCAVCRSASEERPGLWYVIDDVVYCPDCVPPGAGEPAGEPVEVRRG